MKKNRAIIDDNFDINEAEKLGDFYSPYEDVVDTLYRKNNGDLFLHSSGKGCVDEDSEIYHLKYEEAKTWAARCLDTYEYRSVFGKPEKDGEDVTIDVLLSRKKQHFIHQLAELNGCSYSKVIEEMIDHVYEYLKWKCIKTSKDLF